MDTASFLRHIAPAAAARKGVAPDASGLFATDLQDEPVPGRPWWVADSTTPAGTRRGNTVPAKMAMIGLASPETTPARIVAGEAVQPGGVVLYGLQMFRGARLPLVGF